MDKIGTIWSLSLYNQITWVDPCLFEDDTFIDGVEEEKNMSVSLELEKVHYLEFKCKMSEYWSDFYLSFVLKSFFNYIMFNSNGLWNDKLYSSVYSLYLFGFDRKDAKTGFSYCLGFQGGWQQQ